MKEGDIITRGKNPHPVSDLGGGEEEGVREEEGENGGGGGTTGFGYF